MADLDCIKKELGDDWSRVVTLIHTSLESDIDVLNSVNKRILSCSGKQLRPLLSLLAARACSGGHPTEASFRYAAASEMLHNATLLHDDVADDSDQRRGNPTLKALMGPTVSVLVGDFWLEKTMRLVLGSDDDPVNSLAIRVFSGTLSDLAEGEMLQLQKSGIGDTDEEDCKRIIFGKTASLFVTCAVSGAISVGADAQTEEAMRRYAYSLGMAFQIKDDIFDYQASPSAVGKPVGADVSEGLITLPLVGALRNVSPEKDKQIRKKVVEIDSHPESKDEIIAFVKENGGIEYASSRLDDYVREAVEALQVLPESKDKKWLEEIAYFIGKRES